MSELPFGMENRDESEAYFRWQAERFGPFGDSLVVDHGAGTGALTNALAKAGARKVCAVEPDAQLYGVLEKRFHSSPSVTTFHGTLTDWMQSASFSKPSVITSSNVLEHIEDDVACLHEMHSALVDSGKLGLYLPARQELFGALDESVQHYRRYSRSELERKVRSVGFSIRASEYRNVAGVLPWLWTGKVLRKTSIGGGSLNFYDRVVFPVTQWIEDHVPMPYGLNVLLVATKV
jgi:SAM-dependent methyltransferase